MNEFIVWDKDIKIWIDESYPIFINGSGFLCIQRNDKQMVLENDCEVFKPIGITDINNKKIYADCSIVEFDYIKSDNSIKKLWGYFSYNKKRLCYQFIISARERYDYTSIDIRNPKIIGTLQQNPELIKG